MGKPLSELVGVAASMMVDEDIPHHLVASRAQRMAYLATAEAPLLRAAPDLLEACKLALSALEQMTSEDFSLGKDNLIQALAAVIAKAGER